MRLKQLKIYAFKGIDDQRINADGKNVMVRGKNGTGKTSIADAYAWLMTGKSFAGKSIDTQIKKRAADGSTPNDGGIEHRVEAIFTMEDGRDITLSRAFKEKWEKKRGTAKSEFRGHTTSYAIAGVPVRKLEFDKKVQEMTGGEGIFSLLSMPLQFCSMKWDKRRFVLTEMCGQVTDDEIIEKSENLAPLKALLQGHSVEDFRKIVQTNAKKVNEEIKTIPARIDELTKMQNPTERSKSEIDDDLKALQAKWDKGQKALAMLEDGGEAGKLQQEIDNIDIELKKLLVNHALEFNNRKKEAETSARSAIRNIDLLQDDLKRDEIRRKRLEAATQEADKKAGALRQEWREVNAKQFDVEVSDTCPYCGQKLPEEKLAEVQQKAMDDFNLQKARKLVAINAKGKQIMAQKQKDDKSILEIDEEDKKIKVKIGQLQEKINVANEQLKKLNANDVQQNPEYVKLETGKNKLFERLADVRAGNSKKVEEIQEAMNDVAEKMELARKDWAKLKLQEDIKARIDLLKEKENSLGKEFTKLQGQLYLTEQFMRAKVSMTEDSINSHFKYVRWKMFNQKINGALEECCEPLIDGVPFNDGLNKGNRMKAALDILNTFSDFYKKKLPVFIDDCESYSSLPEVDTQVIKLIVDKDCDKLQVEVEK